MARCTWSDGRGNWGIKGVDLAALPAGEISDKRGPQEAGKESGE
ncbi:hypothetical protein [Oscillibacter sp.]|nr:hypothetical protein [Oscillibacter sp.]